MSRFFKRSVFCFVLILTLMLVSGMRVMTVASDPKLSQAAVGQSTRRVDIALNRGSIFDCNGKPLTNVYYDKVTVAFPTDPASVPLSEMLSGDEYKAALNRIRQGNAVTVFGKTPFTKGDWKQFFVPQRYGTMLTHVLGYVGSDGHGVTGIEKAFDDLLYTGSALSISYSADRSGRMLKGLGATVDEGKKGGNVTLTVDSRLQALTEQAMSETEAGAAVILEARTGKLKAVVSCPDYDREDISAALKAQNSPLINRATYSYNVGSVFKPCLAAAALENGLCDYRYTCTGSITVGNVTFKCNRSAGHGELGLKEALAVSCNTYFYTLGECLGAEAVYNMAKALRFGEVLDCGGGVVSSSGAVPKVETLKSIPAELTNLSIGQGELMLSPIALSLLYAAVVNGGEYRLPYIVQSTELDGVEQRRQPSPPTYAFSKKTADILKEYLKNALQNGTGSAAFAEGISSGGKTGTAQTGWRDGDRSILNGWFCGFYEGNETYVIVIVKEDVRSSSTDCAPIFKEITKAMKNLDF